MKAEGKKTAEAYVLSDWMIKNGHLSEKGLVVLKSLPQEMQRMLVEYIHNANSRGVFLADFKPENIYIYRFKGEWKMGLIETDGVYRAKDIAEQLGLDASMTPEQITKQLAYGQQILLVSGVGLGLVSTPGKLKEVLDNDHVRELREIKIKAIDHAAVNGMSEGEILKGAMREGYAKHVEGKTVSEKAPLE